MSGVVPVLVLVDSLSGGLDAEDQCGFPAERIVYVTPKVSEFSGGTCSGVDDSSMGGTSYTLLSLEPSVVPATLPAGSDGGDPDGGDPDGGDPDGGDPDGGDDLGSSAGLYALLLIPVVGAAVLVSIAGYLFYRRRRDTLVEYSQAMDSLAQRSAESLPVISQATE